jgi:hypothetical protein
MRLGADAGQKDMDLKARNRSMWKASEKSSPRVEFGKRRALVDEWCDCSPAVSTANTYYSTRTQITHNSRGLLLRLIWG